MYRLNYLKRIPFLYSFISALFGVFFFILIGSNMTSRLMMNRNFENSSFAMIAEVLTPQNENTFYSSLFFLNTRIVKNDSYINSPKYMTLPDMEYNDIYLTNGRDKLWGELKYDEALVSSNLAKKHKLQAGDFLSIDKGFQKYEYKIVDIIAPYYGDFYFSENMEGIVIFGYNQDVIDDATNIKLVAYSNSSSILFDNNYKLKTELVHENNKNILFGIVGLSLVYILIYIFIEFLKSGPANKDIRTLYINGAKKHQVLLYTILNTHIKYIWMWVLPTIITLILIFSGSLMWLYMLLITYSMMVIFCIIDIIRQYHIFKGGAL